MVNNNGNIDTTRLLTNIGLAVGGYYLVLKPALENLGVLDSEEDKKEEKLLITESKSVAWKRDFYKVNIPRTLMPDAYAKGYAIAIRDALKWAAGTKLEDWLDITGVDFPKLLGVFKNMTTKVMVSQLVAKYYELYDGEDLLSSLTSKLTKEDLLTIINYVKDLPDFKPKKAAGAGGKY